MDFKEMLSSKDIKTKEKTEILSQWVLKNPEMAKDLIEYARASKDADKATCIEALEFATKNNPSIASKAWLDFVTQTLTEKAPRVKWESAKVIGNIAPLFPKDLEPAINNLLINSEHTGTVVRWSTAYALGEIIKMKTTLHKDLIAAAEAICSREENNGVKKIYLAALNKVK